MQVVAQTDNPFLWSLLDRFGTRTGVPVLCNTSLNFKGRWIRATRLTYLMRFCAEAGVRHAVCDDLYLRL